MSRTIGIDLGTSNSVMAYNFKGEPKVVDNFDNSDLLPSVISRGRKGELLVGIQAKRRAVSSSQETLYSVKRFIGRHYNDEMVQKALEKVAYKVDAGQDGDVQVWMGNYSYSPTDISALVLRRLKEDAEKRVGETFSRAVITVPAYFGERQVAATRRAGKLAGFRVIRIINEPTAAALAFGLLRENVDEGKTVLVYDLGGGTFDISIVTMVGGALAVVGTEGDNLLGGDDFDNLIVKFILKKIEEEFQIDVSGSTRDMQTLRQKAEEAKIALSSQQSTDVNIPAFGGENIDLDIELTRAEFEQMIMASIDRTVALTEKALSDSSLNRDDIDYVLLVGGSTSIPLVEQKLTLLFGKEKIRRNVNPMQCVAIGATIQGSLEATIACQACQHVNSIQNDCCEKCGADLSEEQLSCCPTCFTFIQPGEVACFRCQSPVLAGQPAVPKPNVEASGQVVSTRCDTCGKPFPPGQDKCSICNADAFDGLKCPACGTVNPPGVVYCTKCKKEMPISMPCDITPKDLGIELADRRMAVIIPKGQTYPTEQPITREFYTIEPGQRRLEIPVFEGPEPVAERNEMVGLVTMSLPGNLPKGTPVNIGFGLDKDRTITISVRLRNAMGEVKNATLHHGLIDPELRKRAMAEHERLSRFMDRWTEELSPAEMQDFTTSLELLNRAINEDAAHLHTSVEKVLEIVRYKTDLATEARGSDAFNSAILHAGDKYLTEEEKETFQQISEEFDEARAQADWTRVEQIIQRAEDSSNQLNNSILLIIHCRTCANQNLVSPALQAKIYEQLRKIDDGLDQKVSEMINEGIKGLNDLWPSINQEGQLNRPNEFATRVSDRSIA